MSRQQLRFGLVLALSWVITGCIGAKPRLGGGDIAAFDADARAPAHNPFVGARMWVDPDGVALGLARRWRGERPDDAAALERMGQQPTAMWVGDWTPNVGDWVGRQVKRASRRNFLPVFVAYNIPKRDCGQYSRGGASAGDGYRQWISDFAAGIGARKAVVILEPDALAHMADCLTPDDRQERMQLIRYAVARFAGLGNTAVYIDAGHSNWVPAEDMAARLERAGIAQATGFALNVSNYQRNETLIAYGKTIAHKLGDKPFVIDTSRNGNGPPDAEGEASWCNPRGRAVGHPPSADTGEPLVHAFLWVKKPGESDGACNGGPRAGEWWTDIAVELARGGTWN